MRTTIKVLSIISVVLGALAILGAAEGGEDALYSLIGGGYFIVYGAMILSYLGKEKQ